MHLVTLCKDGSFIRGSVNKQFFLFMKLTAILLLAAALQVSAKGMSQNVTLNYKNVPVKKVFKEIIRQTGVSIIYKESDIDLLSKVSISVKNAPLEEALNICFKNEPYKFQLVNNTVVISPNATSINRNEIKVPPSPIEVTGKVSSETGEPLVGVSIVVKGTTKGTSTAKDGSFSVDANAGDVLEFSMVGYKKKSVTVGQDKSIIVVMEIEAVTGNEVVVIGYGTQKKKDVTGSVASVSEKDFTKGVQTNALQLLNGRAAGVQINQASSAPGGGISIKIRGAGSINSSNAPLVVVDGMPAADPSSIDPNDVQSIEVLKDASASAIYGTRAANGVILITTKKGTKGMPSIAYNGYVGVQNIVKKLPVLNATQYMNMVDTVAIANGLTAPYTSGQIASAGVGTNWQDEIFTPAMVQNHSLSFAGASDKSNYYIGLNHFNQDGIVIGSGYKKYGARFNFELNPIEKLKMNFHVEAQKAINRPILTTNAANESAGPINSAIEYDPSISSSLDSNGKYYTNPSIALNNPLAGIYGISNKNTDSRMYGTMSADYSISNVLTATLRLGYDEDFYRQDNYLSRVTINGYATNGTASVFSSENDHWIAEYFMTYNKTFNNLHHLTILGGTTFEDTYNNSVGAGAAGFPTDITGTNLLQSGTASSNTVSSFASENKLNSFLGRLNYSYNDKYLLTGSLRADGTSRFSDKNKYALFPSIALGWRVINESFMKKEGILSDLKLRASYGKIGNQAIGNYQTLQTFSSSGSTVLNDQLVTGVEPTRVPNPDLKWETTAESNIGIDFGLFNQRLTGSIEYYNKNTSNQLFNKPLPASTGFTTELVNFGNVINKGFDILLASQNINKQFKWRTTLTVSTLKNSVTKLPDFVPTPIVGGSVGSFNVGYQIVNVGDPIDAYYGYKVTGIFQKGDDIATSAQPTAHPGDLKFEDLNKDGKINASDRQVLGSPFPKYIIGVSNDFSYKGFSLNLMVNAVQGVSTLDINALEALYPINTYRNRIASYWLERWTPDNPTNKYPSGTNPASYGGALSINSLDVANASFIRLQNATLSYLFSFNHKHSIKSLSVYVAGDNLLTITKFQGYNPDSNDAGTGIEKVNYNSYPLSRVIRFGLNVGF
jgi:TonB-dependent starch-binding outer membrane protein SusC